MTITDAARGANQTFTYDELNRLKTALGKYCGESEANGVPSETRDDDGSRECLKEYFYDETGNITRIVDDGVVKDYSYGGAN